MASMTKKNCQKVIFVTGAGHSGTTLLGMMLGTAKDALFAGEVQEYGLSGNQTCRTCGETCHIWSTIDVTKNVYNELAHESGKSIIIDTSKKVDKWIKPVLSSLADGDVSLIFMTRDPRAIVASELRKQSGLSPTEIVAQWRGQMRRCETLAFDFPGTVVRVQYEELATKTKETLQAVCEALKLPFEEAMLYPWEMTGHQLGGNMGVWSIASGNTKKLSSGKFRYYNNHGKAVKLDQRWKEELTTEALQEIQKEAKSLFYSYRWYGYNG